jgi:ABC-2 type transport system ATP-binding protein
MTNSVVSVEGVSKRFRLYHEKNQYLKSTVLRGKRAKFDEFWALQDISFEISSGSTFGIIGSNGSGKSTLLKCLAGILTPDKGNIAVQDALRPYWNLEQGFILKCQVARTSFSTVQFWE